MKKLKINHQRQEPRQYETQQQYFSTRKYEYNTKVDGMLEGI